jgi:hypothetical protein
MPDAAGSAAPWFLTIDGARFRISAASSATLFAASRGTDQIAALNLFFKRRVSWSA